MRKEGGYLMTPRPSLAARPSLPGLGQGFRFTGRKLGRVRKHILSGKPYAFFPLPWAETRREARQMRKILQEYIECLTETPLLLKAVWRCCGASVTGYVLFASDLDEAGAANVAAFSGVPVILAGTAQTAHLIQVSPTNKRLERHPVPAHAILGALPQAASFPYGHPGRHQNHPQKGFKALSSAEQELSAPANPWHSSPQGFRALSVVEEEIRRHDQDTAPYDASPLPCSHAPFRSSAVIKGNEVFSALLDAIVAGKRARARQQQAREIKEVTSMQKPAQSLYNGLSRVFPALLRRILTSHEYAIISWHRPGTTAEETHEAMESLYLTVQKAGLPFLRIKGARRPGTAGLLPADGLLIVNITFEQAAAFAIAFQQERFVTGHGPSACLWHLHPDGSPEEADEFDLAQALKLPDLSQAPPVTLNFAGRAFALDLDATDYDIFSPQTIAQAQALWHRYGPLMAAHAFFPPSKAIPFITYGYYQPILLLPLSNLAFFSSGFAAPFPTLLSYRVPFAARLIPQPAPSPDDWTCQPNLQLVCEKYRFQLHIP